MPANVRDPGNRSAAWGTAISHGVPGSFLRDLSPLLTVWEADPAFSSYFSGPLFHLADGGLYSTAPSAGNPQPSPGLSQHGSGSGEGKLLGTNILCIY